VGAQVKSGESYFDNAHTGSITIYLRDRLQYLNSLVIPSIVVAYSPARDQGYWANVKQWCADHPEHLEDGKIRISLGNALVPAAFHILRSDARIVLTPRLERSTVREFLEINSAIDQLAFMVIAKHALNQSEFRSRQGIPSLEFLRANGLLSHRESPDGGPSFWRATKKGELYIKFVLGDRYFVPFMLMTPRGPITEDDLDICMDFESYLASPKR
jgi:hypothetical protein